MIKKLLKEINEVERKANNHQKHYNKLWNKRADLYKIYRLLKEQKDVR